MAGTRPGHHHRQCFATDGRVTPGDEIIVPPGSPTAQVRPNALLTGPGETPGPERNAWAKRPPDACLACNALRPNCVSKSNLCTDDGCRRILQRS